MHLLAFLHSLFFHGSYRTIFSIFLDFRIIQLSGYSQSGQHLLGTNVSGLTWHDCICDICDERYIWIPFGKMFQR